MLLQVIYFVLIVCLDEGFAAFSSSIEISDAHSSEAIKFLCLAEGWRSKILWGFKYYGCKKKLKTDNSSVIIQQENERITNKVFWRMLIILKKE